MTPPLLTEEDSYIAPFAQIGAQIVRGAGGGTQQGDGLGIHIAVLGRALGGEVFVRIGSRLSAPYRFAIDVADREFTSMASTAVASWLAAETEHAARPTARRAERASVGTVNLIRLGAVISIDSPVPGCIYHISAHVRFY